ncbi:MAG: aldehyde dehydrogenase family protein [Lachnospiraceae bacterium]|nr:aldehyde dehydrogenase family protein [Lachnospiraceae bacterium]
MSIEEEVHGIVAAQRAFFKTGKTLDVKFRIAQLKALKASVLTHEADMVDALHKDLGRHSVEAFFCDVGSVILEINEAIRGVKRWSRTEVHFSGLVCFPSIFTRVYKMPYGVSLIISPFNFPYVLSLGVLTAAIAGGNTAVIKASSKAPNCTKVLMDIVADAFPPEYITVLGGGHDVADCCLNERFDKIFYTGSTNVGKHVLECASKNLTPVALELGGETGNWCIVRKDADIRDAAHKIAFFKIVNSGQVCVNINQVAVAREIADEFVSAVKEEIIRQIGERSCVNPEYACLISDSAYKKCAEEAELYRERIVFGGEGCPETRKYSPTIIYPVDINEPIVMHELFCPLLPIVPFDDDKIDELLETIESREHGLSLYIFTKNVRWAKRAMSHLQFGGGCINEILLQLVVKGAPFNGTGHSGMGAYHGEWGFREFTHPSTVLVGSRHFNLRLREHPYEGSTINKYKFFKFMEK